MLRITKTESINKDRIVAARINSWEDGIGVIWHRLVIEVMMSDNNTREKDFPLEHVLPFALQYLELQDAI